MASSKWQEGYDYGLGNGDMGYSSSGHHEFTRDAEWRDGWSQGNQERDRIKSERKENEKNKERRHQELLESLENSRGDSNDGDDHSGDSYTIEELKREKAQLQLIKDGLQVLLITTIEEITRAMQVDPKKENIQLQALVQSVIAINQSALPWLLNPVGPLKISPKNKEKSLVILVKGTKKREDPPKPSPGDKFLSGEVEMFCPNGHKVEKYNGFCEKCGVPLHTTCPKGHEVKRHHRFCEKCGVFLNP